MNATETAIQARQETPDSRSTEFKADTGGGEQYSGGTLLVEAYAAIWLLLLAWVLLLWRKQATLTSRLDGLEAAMDRAAAAVAPKNEKTAKTS